MLVGRRTDRVSGNYWSDNRELDLDGDGYTDRPYRLSSVFDHMRGNLTAADLFARSFAATALSAAESTFPVWRPCSWRTRSLARAPRLPKFRPLKGPQIRRGRGPVLSPVRRHQRRGHPNGPPRVCRRSPAFTFSRFRKNSDRTLPSDLTLRVRRGESGPA
jgi:hypothetical protein